jgi:hypothetical protein
MVSNGSFLLSTKLDEEMQHIGKECVCSPKRSTNYSMTVLQNAAYGGIGASRVYEYTVHKKEHFIEDRYLALHTVPV